MPIFVGAVTLMGLLAAIMEIGFIWHAMSWIMLAIPLFVVARYGFRFFR